MMMMMMMMMWQKAYLVSLDDKVDTSIAEWSKALRMNMHSLLAMFTFFKELRYYPLHTYAPKYIMTFMLINILVTRTFFCEMQIITRHTSDHKLFPLRNHRYREHLSQIVK